MRRDRGVSIDHKYIIEQLHDFRRSRSNNVTIINLADVRLSVRFSVIQVTLPSARVIARGISDFVCRVSFIDSLSNALVRIR